MAYYGLYIYTHETYSPYGPSKMRMEAMKKRSGGLVPELGIPSMAI